VAETVVFSSRRVRRVQRMQGARHLLIGLTLAMAGAQAIAAGHHVSWIDYVAVVSGALLMVAFVRELRAAGHASGAHPPHGINWVDVFAAGVTLVEAAHLQHLGKVRLPIAYALLAVFLLALGLFHGRLAQVRRLIVDEHGFDIRLHPWRRVRHAWRDLAAAAADGTSLTLTGLDGRVSRLNLADAPERAAVIDAFMHHATVALAPPPPPPAPPPDDPLPEVPVNAPS
jgi:hypothetical protein